jgi:Fe-S cluster biogenesis protein NfuA
LRGSPGLLYFKGLFHYLQIAPLHHGIKEQKMLKESVETALEEIRPALRADGGDVELVEVTADGVVKVKLTGACHGCPMGTQTLKMGIETHLKQKLPEITEVLGV